MSLDKTGLSTSNITPEGTQCLQSIQVILPQIQILAHVQWTLSIAWFEMPERIKWQSRTSHSLIIGREVLILTLYVLLTLQGCISWYIPRDGLMMREWPYTASNRDELGCTSPPTSRFPSALEMSLGLRPRDISRASGNLLVVGDVQPNTSLLSAVYGYNIIQCNSTPYQTRQQSTLVNKTFWKAPLQSLSNFL